MKEIFIFTLSYEIIGLTYFFLYFDEHIIFPSFIRLMILVNYLPAKSNDIETTCNYFIDIFEF